MEELFEIIRAVNRLKDEVAKVSGKMDILIDTLSESPSRSLSDAYVSEETASAILKRCPRTLLKLRRSGDLSFIRVGKKVLYSTGDLKSFLEKSYSKN